MDIPQCAPLGFLHHHADGLVVAFKIPLHCPEHSGLGRHGIPPGGHVPDFFLQFVPAFDPGILPEGVARDGVVGRGHFLLGFFQFPAAVIQIGLGFLLSRRTGGQVGIQLLQPLLGLRHAFFQTPHVCLTSRDIRRQRGFLPPQLQKLLGQSLRAGGHGGELVLQIVQLPAFSRESRFNFFNSGLRLVDLGHDAAGAVFLPFQLFLNAGNVGVVVLHIAPKHGHLPVQLLMRSGQHIHFQADGFQFAVPGTQGFAQLVCLTVQGVQIVMRLLQNEGRGRIVLLRLLGGGGKPVQRVQPHGHLHALQLVLQFQIFFCLFRLLLQRFQLQFQLGDLVADAQKVVLGGGQLPFRLLLAVAVFGDAGGFLEDLPAVAAFQGEDFVDPALTDIAVALPPKAGVHEHLVDVPQAGGLLIDVIFAVPGAVVAPGDHHLVGIVGQRPVGVVQRQGRLGEAHGGALLGAAEDHVFHFGAPEGFGALFAHDPQNGVGNIRFSGAVGADDGGNVVAEPDQRLVREGLKALQFQ